jgi:hypothetical protein
MTVPRLPSEQERGVISALLSADPEMTNIAGGLDGLRVVEMTDGGMGSLSLVPEGNDSTVRSLGRQVAAGEFTDRDGVPVSVALNVDQQGKLFELDVWKVNFAPLLSWPSPAEIILRR